MYSKNFCGVEYEPQVECRISECMSISLLVFLMRMGGGLSLHLL